MKAAVAAFLALAILGVIYVWVQAQPRGGRRGDWQAVENGWLFSLQEGKALARKTGKPLMVVIRCVP